MSTAIKKLRKLERPPRGGAATMVEAIRAGIWEEMERDPTVFLIGEDVGVYGGAFKVTEGLIDHSGSVSRAVRLGSARGSVSFAERGIILSEHGRIEDGRAFDGVRCEGTDQG